MILTCPQCGSQFRVAAEKLGLYGRTVRCSRCKHSWHATPDDDESEELELSPDGEPNQTGEGTAAAEGNDGAGEAASPHAFDEDLAEFRAAHRRAMRAANPEPDAGRRFPLGWLVFAAVVLAIVAGGWFGRQQVVAYVPQTAALYDLAGVPVNSVAPGLKLRDVTRRRQLVNDTNQLVLEGRIVNSGDRAQSVPPIRATLYNQAGERLTAWRFRAEASQLAPGAETTFSSRRPDPPKEARELSLTFVASSS
ncbi:MJ0042 family finger-like domain-containing protein [Limimonas halophila]|uniref:MJ0042 family finger-like domain-containing protein n=1 Tax=Limimonas halophila TaxID=1082479 RepID=A0A1G7TSS9_9PROT|nr:DUF3426 domain-containing protein [Limimonas halophila]SDG38373.1 MJ0042 family finger-like domain-containing protein [Limimonas halophila]